MHDVMSAGPLPTQRPKTLVPLATLKEWLGLPAAPDPVLDAKLDRIGQTVTEKIRRYVGQDLTPWISAEERFEYRGGWFHATQRPIISVISFYAPGLGYWDGDLQIHNDHARIRPVPFEAGFWQDWRGWRDTGYAAVVYAHGFDPVPPDLLDCYATLVDARNSAGGAGAGGGGTIVQGSGELKKLSIIDVVSADFDVGATVSGGGTASRQKDDALGELAPFVSTLDAYRSVHQLIGAT